METPEKDNRKSGNFVFFHEMDIKKAPGPKSGGHGFLHSAD
jgi:hypothetical protein